MTALDTAGRPQSNINIDLKYLNIQWNPEPHFIIHLSHGLTKFVYIRHQASSRSLRYNQLMPSPLEIHFLSATGARDSPLAQYDQNGMAGSSMLVKYCSNTNKMIVPGSCSCCPRFFPSPRSLLSWLNMATQHLQSQSITLQTRVI